MRPAPPPAVVAASAVQQMIHLTSSQPPLPHGGSKWPPPSPSTASGASGDIEAYGAIAIILLFCALICALALHGSIRCFLRRPPPQEQGSRLPKHVDESAAAPVCPGPAVVFSPGMDMAGTGECAICLTEFAEGEEIRLMAECRHGFHVQCIERWLCSHSSCPTCRRNCLVVDIDLEDTPQAPSSSSVPRQHHFSSQTCGNADNNTSRGS